MKIEQQLIQYIKHKAYIQISLKNGSSEPICGVPVNCSDKFVLLIQIKDFISDGIIIIPLEKIENIKYSNTEKFFNTIIHKENLIDLKEERIDINLSSWKDLLTSLQRNSWIIEVIDEEDTLVIGKVTKVMDNYFSMTTLNTVGMWNDKSSNIVYTNIANIVTLDKYSIIFGKYATSAID